MTGDFEYGDGRVASLSYSRDVSASAPGELEDVSAQVRPAAG